MMNQYWGITWVFALVVLSFSPTFSSAQQYQDFESLEQEARSRFPDAQYVVQDALEVYSFLKSNSEDSPIKAVQQSIIDIVNLEDKPVKYIESTNMKSSVESSSAQRYDSNKGRMVNCRVSSEAYRVESGGIFHNDFFVNPIQIDVWEKGIYKLTYEKRYSDYKFLSYLPIRPHETAMRSRIEVKVPNWLEIELIEQNFDHYEIKKEVLPGEKLTSYVYTWKGIPTIKNYPYSASVKHYLPHILVVYKNKTDKDGQKTPMMPDTQSQYDWYHKLVAEIRENPEEIAVLTEKFKSMPQGLEQIEAVNNWIRENIRYIAFEAGIAGFKPDACQKVYNNKYGDCKGMANLYKNTMVSLGYDARLAWIGTRNEVPYTYDIPSLLVDNHMIAAVIFESDTIFVDPTETYGTSSEIAFRIQGRPVLIENGSDFIVSKVPTSDPFCDQISREIDATFNIESAESQYTVKSSFTGEPKKRILSGFNSVRGEYKDEALENYLRPNDEASLNIINHTGLNDSINVVSFEYEYSNPKNIINAGGEYYIEVDPTWDLRDVDIIEDRVATWFFNERYNRKTNINFIVPENFSLIYHPESFQVVNDNFTISVSVSQQGSTLSISKTIQILSGEVKKENQAEFESALSKLNAYYEETVIIKSL